MAKNHQQFAAINICKQIPMVERCGPTIIKYALSRVEWLEPYMHLFTPLQIVHATRSSLANHICDATIHNNRVTLLANHTCDSGTHKYTYFHIKFTFLSGKQLLKEEVKFSLNEHKNEV